MQKYAKIVTIIVFLVITALLAYCGLDIARENIIAYRSPLAGVFPLPGDPIPAQSDRVVLVVISGLGVENRDEEIMPTFQLLEESGASAVMEGQAPSYQSPAWTSLISGAYPWLNDAPLFDLFPAAVRPITVNTIFQNASQQSIKVVVAGSTSLTQFLSSDWLDNPIILPIGNTSGTASPVDRIAETLADDSVRLVLVQLSAADEIAAANGTAGDAYQTALKTVDAQLDHLVSLIDLNKTTLIVTADYGHIEEGGHGGADISVLQLPLVMAGHKVIPGGYSDVEQVDVAPTISALLGLPFPAGNQGRPRLELLQISDRDSALMQVELAKQRTLLASAYLASAGLPPVDWTEVEQAAAFWQAENYAGAEELAQLLVAQADEAIQQANDRRLKQTQWPRLAAVVLLAAAFLLFIRRNRTELWIDALVSGVVVVGVFHLLYLVIGKPYSFSAITDWQQTRVEIIRYLLVSVLFGELVFLLFLLLRQCTDAWLVLQGSYELFLFMVIGFLAPVLYAFWQVGPTLTAYTFNISTLFTYLTGLVQTFWAVAIGFFVPIVTVGLNMALQNLLEKIRIRQIEKMAGN